MGKEVIESIRSQRRRARRAMEKRMAEDDDLVVVKDGDDHDDANAFWAPLFRHYFVESHDDSRDDMLFFVRNAVDWGGDSRSRDNSSDDSLGGDESPSDPYFVRRKNGKRPLPPPSSPRVNWEESFYLNLIVNQIEYTLTVAVCKHDSGGKLRCLSRVSQRVYGSPNRRQMHMTDKAVETELTYPLIYFTVDNFDDIFGEVFVQQDEALCVELVASTPIITKDMVVAAEKEGDGAEGAKQAGAHATHASTSSVHSSSGSSRPVRSTIFQGQVGFAALRQAYCARQREGASLLSTRSKMEYLLLRGPGGKGGAQVAMGPIANVERLRDTPRGRMLAANAVLGGGTRPEEAPAAGKEGGGLFSGALSSLKKMSQSLTQSLFKADDPESYTALNSFLTYVSIPWHTIVDDVLDKHPAPILERMKMHAQVSDSPATA